MATSINQILNNSSSTGETWYRLTWAWIQVWWSINEYWTAKSRYLDKQRQLEAQSYDAETERLKNAIKKQVEQDKADLKETEKHLDNTGNAEDKDYKTKVDALDKLTAKIEAWENAIKWTSSGIRSYAESNWINKKTWSDWRRELWEDKASWTYKYKASNWKWYDWKIWEKWPDGKPRDIEAEIKNWTVKETSAPTQGWWAPAHVQWVNQYDQANGQHYYDASAIPEVLDKWRITPSQYVNNNWGNWDKDRERLAKEAWISNYTWTPWQNYQIVQHMEDVKKWIAWTTAAAAATTTTPEDTKNKELNTQFFWTYDKDKTFSGNWLPTWLSQEAQDKIINANVGNIYKTDMVKDEALKKVKEMIAKDPTMLQKFWIDSVAYQSWSKEISKDDAMKFLNAGDAYFSKEQKAADKWVSPARVMDKWREALLQDIASGKKSIGKDVQTTLSADEEKYIKQVKLTNYKNIIKKEMSWYLNRMNQALKNKDVEWAKKIKQEWKDYIVNERNKNDNFSIIESELQKETKNIEKWLATPDEDVRVYTEKQPTAPAAPAAPTPTAWTTVDKGWANAPVAPTPTSTIPNPTPVTPWTAWALNTWWAADTLYAKIEQSKNKPDELQSTGAPKNRIKPN